MENKRLLSLDIMRGLTVIGMIIVNSVYEGIFNQGGMQASYDSLYHVSWNGATLADVVFPFFILMIGVSIPFAYSGFKESSGLTKALLGRIFKRGLLLFIIGMGLTFYYFDMDGDKSFRIFGVLQRIGLVFIGAAVIFMMTNVRTQIIIIAVILLGYWALLYAPFLDGSVNLMVPGQNFIHWVDRAVLGSHLYVTGGEYPYDPEGILSSFPAIAQALIGAVIGSFLKSKQHYMQIFGIGIMMVGAAMVLDIIMPVNKSLWSSSFVLYTSGLGIIILMALFYVIDIRGYNRGLGAIEAYGKNALFAYILHSFTTGYLLSSQATFELFSLVSRFIKPEISMLFIMFIVLVITWIPLGILRAKKIIIKV